MSKLRLYRVWGPKYEKTEYIPYLMSGPRYSVQDRVDVLARSKRRARVLALRAFRHERQGLVKRYNDLEWLDPGWGGNPFAMMEVERLDDEPKAWLCDCRDVGNWPDENCRTCEGKGFVYRDDGGVMHGGPRMAGDDCGRSYIADRDAPEVTA